MAVTPRRPVLAIAIASLFATLTMADAVWANQGQLLLVVGNVTLHRDRPAADNAGQSSRAKPAAEVIIPSAGYEIQSGDTLITGYDGRVQIRFSDGSLVSMQPRTEFRIDRYRYDTADQRSFFSLAAGAIRTVSGMIGKRNPADYRLSTPAATIGIRGTQFVVEQTVCDPGCYPGNSAGLRVAVTEGHVVVGNRAGFIEIPAGQAAFTANATTAPVATNDRPQLTTATTVTRTASAASAGRSNASATSTGNGSSNSSGSSSASTGSEATAVATAAANRLASRAAENSSTDQRRLAETDGSNAIRSVADIEAELARASRPGLVDSSVAAIGESRNSSGTLVAIANLSPMPSGNGSNSGSSGNSGNSGSLTPGGGNAGGNNSGGNNGGTTDPGGNNSGGNNGGTTDPGGNNSGGEAPVTTHPALTVGTNTVETSAFLAPSAWALSWLAPVTDKPTFDSQMQLQSIGNCPSGLCLSRGTARVVEAGGHDHLRWGRWIDGVSYLTVAGIAIPRALSINGGQHYLVGTPTVTMPTAGEARYSLDGATAATYSDGLRASGTFSGQAQVQFGTGTATRVGVDASVTFSDGASYRMQTQGGLGNVSQSELRMNSGTGFAGNVGVESSTVDPVGCRSGACRANISGGFYGPNARSMGLQYSVGRATGSAGAGSVVSQTGTTIQGVAGLSKSDPAP